MVSHTFHQWQQRYLLKLVSTQLLNCLNLLKLVNEMSDRIKEPKRDHLSSHCDPEITRSQVSQSYLFSNPQQAYTAKSNWKARLNFLLRALDIQLQSLQIHLRPYPTQRSRNSKLVEMESKLNRNFRTTHLTCDLKLVHKTLFHHSQKLQTNSIPRTLEQILCLVPLRSVRYTKYFPKLAQC